MVQSNWYGEYLKELYYYRCMYNVHKVQFILTMLEYGHPTCEVFTCGYEHNLVKHVEYRKDNRISSDWLCVEKYPSYMDWLNALRDWNSVICKDDFDKPRVVKGDDYIFEAFTRVFKEWEYNLKYFTRYIMVHEARYGTKPMWNKY